MLERSGGMWSYLWSTGILKRKPSARLTLEEISSHPWLEGRTVWQPGESDYKAHPRLGGDLSSAETEVLERLRELGISEQTLRGEMMLGVRSPVIATYRWANTTGMSDQFRNIFRILLHKALGNRRKSISIKSTTSIKSKIKYAVDDDLNIADKDVQSSTTIKVISRITKKNSSRFCLILWFVIKLHLTPVFLKQGNIYFSQFTYIDTMREFNSFQQWLRAYYNLPCSIILYYPWTKDFIIVKSWNETKNRGKHNEIYTEL